METWPTARETNLWRRTRIRPSTSNVEKSNNVRSLFNFVARITEGKDYVKRAPGEHKSSSSTFWIFYLTTRVASVERERDSGRIRGEGRVSRENGWRTGGRRRREGFLVTLDEEQYRWGEFEIGANRKEGGTNEIRGGPWGWPGPFHLHGCRPSVILNPDSPLPVIAWKSGWFLLARAWTWRRCLSSKHSLEPGASNNILFLISRYDVITDEWNDYCQGCRSMAS